MAIANRGVFGNHLDGDVNYIFFDEFEAVNREYEKIAKIETAPPGNHYTESELSGLGHLEEKGEGGAITFDIPQEGHKKSAYYTSYAKGFQITQEMYKDDLFGNFKRLPSKLGKSAAVKPDVVFFNTVFNNGFDTTTGRDGQYVFDDAHDQLKTEATVANEPTTAADLSEAALQAAFEHFWGLEDETGMPISMQPGNLLIHPNNIWTAQNLKAAGQLVGSANNDINTVNPDNGVVDAWSIMTSRFLTDEDAWFLISADHDARLYWKENAKIESADDFYTGNALFKVTMRFAVFVMDWRGLYGSPGA